MVNLISRIAAAILGGYAFVWGFTALLIATALQLRLPYGDAQTAAYLMAFLVFVGAIIWTFAVRRVAAAWAALAGGGLSMATLAWLLTRSAG